MQIDIKKYGIVYLLLVSLTFLTCIERLEEEPPEPENIVVVDGQFSSRDGRQEIRLSQTFRRDNQSFEPVSGASVFVLDDVGNRLSFVEGLEPGIYLYNGKASAEKEYRLEVTLSDGTEITSRYQKVPAAVPLDNIGYLDTLISFVNDDGRTTTRSRVDIFVETELDRVEEPIFLRYDIETVWQLLEIRCDPWMVPARCYVYDTDLSFDLTLLDISSQENPLSIRQKVYSRLVDNAFGEVISFKVDAISYNEEEFNYWQRIQDVFTQTGSVTDILPARVRSLLETTNGTEVLGQFSVVGQSEQVLFLRNSDIQFMVNPFCGVPGIRPTALPGACCSCTLQPGASKTRPYYWPE